TSIINRVAANGTETSAVKIGNHPEDFLMTEIYGSLTNISTKNNKDLLKKNGTGVLSPPLIFQQKVPQLKKTTPTMKMYHEGSN
ncbi:hypothetical protein QYM36_018526, partial [Artemia franciscana]